MAQTVQILRSTTNNPPATLLPGALSVELGTDTRLWVGAGGGNRLLLSSNPADTSAAGGAYLKLIGGTMTGPIVLPGNPTLPLQTAPKQYVDAGDATLAAADTTIRNTYLPLTGGTLTGPLALMADPTLALQAATKQYVDVRAGATVGAAPPTAVPGALWWDSNGGQMYVRYDDGNTVQWVVANSIAGLANVALKTDVAAAYNNVGRNTIHNPLFNIAQRGAGPFTGNGYSLDRWNATTVGGSQSVTRLALTDTDRSQIGDEAAVFAFQNVFAGGAAVGNQTVLFQPTEGVRRTGGKTITLSFYAKAASGTPKLGTGFSQSFGTGGSPSANVDGAGQAITLSTVWVRYSLTFTIPSTAGKTLGTNGDDILYAFFWLSAEASLNTRSGSVGVQSGTIQIWGVQLEIGSTMTALEKPDPQQDLAKCQRFYQRGSVFQAFYHTAGSGCAMTVFLPVNMRASQTINILTNGDSNLTTPTAGSLSGSSIYFLANAVATGGVTFSRTFELSSDL